jgi:hypothetical protein
VATSLRTGKIEDWATGARALAERYALLIDRAEDIYREFDELLEDLEPGSEALAQRIRKLQAAVEAQTVASDLGPKLLAALDRLGLTPLARTGPPRKDTADAKPASPERQLDELKQRRAARRQS